MNNRRRNFRPRQQKNNFIRRRNGSSNSNSYSGNGNINFNRNGSMNNSHNVEKAMQKFQQLAKDAQSNGDPVQAQNYLQHADHYLRRLNELIEKKSVLTIGLAFSFQKYKKIPITKSDIKVDYILTEKGIF